MRKFLVAGFALVAFCALSAQAQTLSPSAKVPTVDGVLGADEYSVTGTYGDMTLGASLSADGKTLSLALAAPTPGWVSIGLGSSRMHNARMILAYDANGTVAVSEETGIGHSHKKAADPKVQSSSVHEADGTTTLEFTIPADGFTGGKNLDLILAYGGRDDFTSMHRKFAFAKLPLAK
jgi:hypothetical protein